MGTSRHFILKQYLNLEHDAATDSHLLSTRLSEVFRNRLAAIIERALDEVDQPGRLVRLDKVVVGLDCRNLDDVEDLLSERLSIELEAALRHALDDPVNTEVTTQESGVFEAVTFYLDKGYLPWNASGSMTLAELEFRLTEALDGAPALARKLARVLLEHPRSMERFATCFSAKMKWRLAELLWPGVEEAWKGNAPPATEKAPERLLFWKLLYEQLYAGVKDGGQVAVSIQEALQKRKKKKQAGESAEREENGNKEKDTSTAEEEQVPDEGIFVRNAGVVILNPFLETLFAELGVADGNAITQPEKAVQILHYAVTGRQIAGEWEFPLFKLLCGIPLDEVIHLEEELSAAETAEVDTMLSSLIKYWEILKNTGTDGLQEAFLQREGRITQGRSNWILRVQQQGIDVVVGHLPWSIGFIKLPWMERALVTEWN